MEAFATVSDLRAGWAAWSELTEDEKAQAETLIERATAHLLQLMKAHGVSIDAADPIQVTNIVSVTCNMVRRSMSPGYEGVKSFAQSIGSTNVSVNYRENDGGFFVTKQEKELLGISGRGRMMMLRPAIHNPDGSLVDGW